MNIQKKSLKKTFHNISKTIVSEKNKFGGLTTTQTK